MTQSEAIKMLADWLQDDGTGGSPDGSICEARRRYLDMVQANVAALNVELAHPQNCGAATGQDHTAQCKIAVELTHATIIALDNGHRANDS